jgi:succinyl-CoA synthetase beta subunit
MITSLQDLDGLAYPLFLKAQVPVGKRGKAGAIQYVGHAGEATIAAEELFRTTIGGYPVSALLAEEPVEVRRELFLAVLIDTKISRPLVMVSQAGGMDIEEDAGRNPEKIFKQYYDLHLGIQDFQLRYLAKSLDLENSTPFSNLVKQLTVLARDVDAMLLEINPLALTAEGLVALDAKVILDDKATYRQRDLFQKISAEQQRIDTRKKSEAVRMAEAANIQYVPLDGDIGIIADGAGTGMLTLDMVIDAGGRAANFCEMGGQANAVYMEKAMAAILANPRVKGLVISLIGGMTRMDEMAEGIVNYMQKAAEPVPMVVRMCGTKADVGVPLLKQAHIETFVDLDQAIQAIMVKLREMPHGNSDQ